MPHKPVLLREALEFLALKPGAVVVDGTAGSGGHAEAIAKTIGERGRLIGLDQDPEAVRRCREKIKAANVSFFEENFQNTAIILERLNLPAADAVLLDVGFSSDQLEDASRGFSFDRDGPLDMRMSPKTPETAADLLRDLSERELEQIFRDYGEERRARPFARAIARARRRERLQTTGQLVRVLTDVLPAAFSRPKGKRPEWARRHPATRVFQALRIAVNDELTRLREALPEVWKVLAPGGRLVVISFHSLEDRIVKEFHREHKRAGDAVILTKKPVTPGAAERRENPRARSAKLRALEKKGTEAEK